MQVSWKLKKKKTKKDIFVKHRCPRRQQRQNLAIYVLQYDPPQGPTIWPTPRAYAVSEVWTIQVYFITTQKGKQTNR